MAITPPRQQGLRVDPLYCMNHYVTSFSKEGIVNRSPSLLLFHLPSTSFSRLRSTACVYRLPFLPLQRYEWFPASTASGKRAGLYPVLDVITGASPGGIFYDHRGHLPRPPVAFCGHEEEGGDEDGSDKECVNDRGGDKDDPKLRG